MSSSEDEEKARGQFNEEQVEEIRRISNLRKQEFAERFLVSGWDDDTEGLEEEKNPHAKPETEILWAAENGELELTKTLVSSNRELLKIKDKDGYSPLHRACYNNHVDIVEFLLLAGADFSATTNDLWQPLHSACRWNNALSVAKLLDVGADINCKSKGGQTPLHLAASNGEAKETLQLLLMNPNIDSTIKNENDETAYEVAVRSGKYYKLFEIVHPDLNCI